MGASSRQGFPGTRWTLVIRAGEGARIALQELCEAYWLPLYGYVRRQGYGPEDAQDLTQGFFVTILERNEFRRVRRERGRFRSYLLAAMRNYLSNERVRQQALKRGGGIAPLSLDWSQAEAWYRDNSNAGLDPERLYQRQWTITLLQRVLLQLKSEFQANDRAEAFAAMQPFLTGAGPSYAEVAAQLDSSAGAVKVAVHRLRKRYRALLREEVQETVGHIDTTDSELRELLSSL